MALEKHFEGLAAIAFDPDIWALTIEEPKTRDDLTRYLNTALTEQTEGRSLPFATIDLVSGRVAGCTRFMSIEHRHQRLEIGATFIGAPFRRTHVNTEAKYLMFTHAFETLGCARVELKTNVLNLRSRNAMKRIGCTEEGVLRKHAINTRGVWRDTIYFSVLDDEWPRVKAHLQTLIQKP